MVKTEVTSWVKSQEHKTVQNSGHFVWVKGGHEGLDRGQV